MRALNDVGELRHFSRSVPRQGAIAVMAAIVLVIMIAMIAFAIDIGMINVAKTELQAAVDASALAGVNQLTNGEDQAIGIARNTLSLNALDPQKLTHDERAKLELVFGQWDRETRSFKPVSFSQADSLKVAVAHNQLPSFFGRIFRQRDYAVEASAIARMGNAPRDIVLVLDLSGSMASHGRIQALRNAAPVFIDTLVELQGDDHVAVLGLSSRPDRGDGNAAGGDEDDAGDGTEGNGNGHWTNYYSPSLDEDFVKSTHCAVLERHMTDDLLAVRNETLTTSNLLAKKYGGGTGIGACIRDAVYYLTTESAIREEAEKVIVLMTDGIANKPNQAEAYARQQALLAAQASIRIYTISLGDSGARPLMQQVADVTHGVHYDATGSGESLLTLKLQNAFRQAAIGNRHPTLVD